MIKLKKTDCKYLKIKTMGAKKNADIYKRNSPFIFNLFID